MYNAPSPIDPFVLTEAIFAGQAAYRNTPTPRLITVDPHQKTLVLLIAGQSNWTNINPTLYNTTNPSAVSQMNIYDGSFYAIQDYVIGSSFYFDTRQGNISVRLADQIINSGTFNQVILCNYAVGSTPISYWNSTGVLYDRGDVAMKRLKKAGITPSTPGVTFAFLWGQGEGDTVALTSQSVYAAGLNDVINKMTASGFVGRFFICKESWIFGAASTAVSNAQIGILNPSLNIYSGGNLDSFGASFRQADNTHFNDSGAAAVASLVYNTMHASGSPF